MLGDSFLRRQIQPSLGKGFDMEEESSMQFCYDSVSWCPGLSRNPVTDLVNGLHGSHLPHQRPHPKSCHQGLVRRTKTHHHGFSPTGPC